MKKVVYTLALEGYPEEMTDLTFPWLKHYAHKIGAEFFVIKDRKFPDWPPTAEKCQIFELGKNIDWNVYVDADALINPEMFDVTSVVHKDTVVFTGQDMAAMRFRPNRYGMRDGRYIGACTWFVACSDWTIDLWRPLDIPFKEAIQNIFPTNAERLCRIGDGTKSITPDKLIEDYICSNNIARFGLKHITVEHHLKQAYNRMYDSYYWHQYTMEIDAKILQMLQVMRAWGMITPEIAKKYDAHIQRASKMPPMQPQPRPPLVCQ
jgi:hypothetical protein